MGQVALLLVVDGGCLGVGGLWDHPVVGGVWGSCQVRRLCLQAARVGRLVVEYCGTLLGPVRNWLLCPSWWSGTGRAVSRRLDNHVTGRESPSRGHPGFVVRGAVGPITGSIDSIPIFHFYLPPVVSRVLRRPLCVIVVVLRS